MQRFLVLWLPHWGVQRQVSNRRDWCTAPHALASQIPLTLLHTLRGKTMVVDASPEAYRWGMKPGMSWAEAQSLAGRQARCQLETAPLDVNEDQATLRALGRRCQQFVPQVSLEPECANPRLLDWIDNKETPPEFLPATRECLLLELSSVTERWGGEEKLLRHLLQIFEQEYLYVRGGVANSIGAAWGLAHFGLQPDREDLDPSGSQHDNRQVAAHRPLVKHLAFPTGSIWLASSQTLRGAIRSLPLPALRLPATTLQLLNRCGLQTIDDLFRIPRHLLPARFGADLLLRLDQACGTTSEIWEPIVPAAEFSAEKNFSSPTAQHDVITESLLEIGEQLAARLSEHHYGALALRLTLFCDVAQDHNIDIPSCEERAKLAGTPNHKLELPLGLFRASVAPGHWLQLVSLQLEQTTLPGPVEKMVWQVERLAALTWHQPSLFSHLEGEPLSSDSLSLVTLVDRLACRLGPQQVVRATLTRDPQPERAYLWIPLHHGVETERPGAGAGRSQAGTFQHLPGRGIFRRPLRLFPHPQPIEVTTARGSAYPVAFRLRGTAHVASLTTSWQTIANYVGPERIETGWWRKARIYRDYFRIETCQGERYWIFRSLTKQRWFIHGSETS